MEVPPKVLETAEESIAASTALLTKPQQDVEPPPGGNIAIGVSATYPPIKQFIEELPAEDPAGFAIMNQVWGGAYLGYLRNECRRLDKLLLEGLRRKSGSLNFASPAARIRSASSTYKKSSAAFDAERGRLKDSTASSAKLAELAAELANKKKHLDEEAQSAFSSHIQLVRDRWILGVRNELSWHKNCSRWKGDPGTPKKEEGYSSLPSVNQVDPKFFELAPVPYDLSPPNHSDSESSRAVCLFLEKLYQVSILSPEKDQDGFDDGRKIPFYVLLRRPHDSGTAWGRKNMVVDVFIENDTKPKTIANTPGGFWDPVLTTMFLTRFEKAAALLKMRWWHGIYNDYRVIEMINDRLNAKRAKPRIFVGFKGNITDSKANYHGPYPLGFIHIHLDLIP